jgi:hypothetical protein
LSPTPEWCAREKPTTFEKGKPYTSQQQKRKENKLETKHNPSAPATQRSHPRYKPRARRAKNRALFCEERDQRLSLQLALLAQSTLSHYIEHEEGSFSFTSSTFPFFSVFFISFFLLRLFPILFHYLLFYLNFFPFKVIES